MWDGGDTVQEPRVLVHVPSEEEERWATKCPLKLCCVSHATPEVALGLSQTPPFNCAPSLGCVIQQ